MAIGSFLPGLLVPQFITSWVMSFRVAVNFALRMTLFDTYSPKRGPRFGGLPGDGGELLEPLLVIG